MSTIRLLALASVALCGCAGDGDPEPTQTASYWEPDPFGLGIPDRPTLYAQYSTNLDRLHIEVISDGDTLLFEPARPWGHRVPYYPVTALEQGEEYTVRFAGFNDVSFLCCDARQYIVSLFRKDRLRSKAVDTAAVETNVEIGSLID